MGSRVAWESTGKIGRTVDSDEGRCTGDGVLIKVLLVIYFRHRVYSVETCLSVHKEVKYNFVWFFIVCFPSLLIESEGNWLLHTIVLKPRKTIKDKQI